MGISTDIEGFDATQSWVLYTNYQIYPRILTLKLSLETRTTSVNKYLYRQCPSFRLPLIPRPPKCTFGLLGYFDTTLLRRLIPTVYSNSQLVEAHLW